MLFARGAGGLLMLGLWIFCIIDVITTPESEVRNLPKTVWLLIVLLLPAIGSIAWLVAGRQWGGSAADRPDPMASHYPEYGRPGRFIPANPQDDEEFLRKCRELAEEQRRQARESLRNEDGDENRV